MAEAITEMIIPGTYIEVRSEGLIGVSGIATGNVGVVGTASKGPLSQAVIVSSLSEAKDIFGDYDAWIDGNSGELTLVRALQQVFANGGSTVYAVRTASAGVDTGVRILNDAIGPVVTFKAKTPGTWSGDITVQALAATSNGFVESNAQTLVSATVAPLHAHIADAANNSLKVVKSVSGKVIKLAIKTSGSPAKNKSVVVDPATGEVSFDAADAPAAGDQIIASYQVDKAFCRQIEVVYGNVKEVYTSVDATDLQRDVAAGSALVSVDIAASADKKLPDIMDTPLPLSGGSNGESAGATEYATDLAKLDGEDVNIAVLAGLTLKDSAAALEAHAETAENNGRDRITVAGVDADDINTVGANANSVADDRVILVAPGILAQDLASGKVVKLTAAYAAAAVAGLIASLAVQVSPTNKTLSISGLTTEYNDGQLKKLITGRVLALEKKAGFRVVKGITTDDGAFRQISVRRIVDYAKAGTRIGSLPYIGKLNNARVRAALKATLNGFLSDMVLNEALTEFTLDVSATREQEIAGVCLVTMLLKPTFSIDYIKVIMNLA